MLSFDTLSQGVSLSNVLFPVRGSVHEDEGSDKSASESGGISDKDWVDVNADTAHRPRRLTK